MAEKPVDKEVELYRSLLETPTEFKDGFGWSTVVGIIFCGLVMMPGGIYLGLMSQTMFYWRSPRSTSCGTSTIRRHQRGPCKSMRALFCTSSASLRRMKVRGNLASKRDGTRSQ